MLIIEKPGKKTKYFAEITDFPYANTLSAESYNHLKTTLEEKIENYYKQQRYIAILMARKNKKKSS